MAKLNFFLFFWNKQAANSFTRQEYEIVVGLCHHLNLSTQLFVPCRAATYIQKNVTTTRYCKGWSIAAQRTHSKEACNINHIAGNTIGQLLSTQKVHDLKKKYK